MKRLLAVFAIFTLSALAADITGKWKATGDGQNGPMERTFTFKQDGTKLTGETESSFAGKSTITDGKVEGDNVSFTINMKFQDQEMKMEYKGKVSGSEIKFTAEAAGGGGFGPITWTAKKQ